MSTPTTSPERQPALLADRIERLSLYLHQAALQDAEVWDVLHQGLQELGLWAVAVVVPRGREGKPGGPAELRFALAPEGWVCFSAEALAVVEETPTFQELLHAAGVRWLEDAGSVWLPGQVGGMAVSASPTPGIVLTQPLMPSAASQDAPWLILGLAGERLGGESLPAVSRLGEHLSLALGYRNRLLEQRAAQRTESALLKRFETWRDQFLLAQTLQDVGELLTSQLSLTEVLEQILDLLGRVLPYDSASIYLYREESSLRLATGRGSSKLPEILAHEPYLDEESWRQGQAVILQPSLPGTRPDEQVIIRCRVAAPLLVKGKLIGSLHVDSRLAEAYDEQTAETVQSFANQAAIAIENARLFEAEQVAHRNAEALQDAARSLNATLSLEDIMGVVLDQLLRLLPFDRARVMMIEGKILAVNAWLGYSAEDARAIKPFLPVYQEVLQTGQAMMLGASPGGPHGQALETAGVKGWLGVPLQAREQVFGLLSLERISAQGSPVFNAREISLAMSFAFHASAAIENARLFAAVEQRAAELLAVRQATLSLTASLELDEVLQKILESTLHFLPGIQTAFIFLYFFDQSSERLLFRASLAKEGEAIGKSGDLANYSIPDIEELAYQVARSGQVMVVSDMQAGLPLTSASIWEALELTGALVGLPLKMGQRVVGVMNLLYPGLRSFEESELRILSLLGDQAAIAIENARLYERAATERRHLELLYQLGQELTTSLEDRAILERAIDLTCQVLEGLVGEAYLYTPENNLLSLNAVYGREVAPLEAMNERLHHLAGKGRFNAGWLQEAHSIRDVDLEPDWYPLPELEDGVRSVILAPVISNYRLRGVLAVLHSEPAAFSSEHLELLQGICQQVAIALNNAERYQQVQKLVDMLAVEQYRLEGLLERLPVGVLVLDAGYHLQVANLLGRETLAQLRPEEDAGRLVRLAGSPIEAVLTLQDGSEPIEMVVPGPPRLLIELAASPIYAEPRQWVILLRDVTQERERQERIKMQDRLATVGQLAAGIAHDFNNIMAAIMVYTDLLMRDRTLPSKSRERVAIIQQQVQRASSLIRQILDFSRRSLMEQIPLDLLPFIKEFSKLLMRLLPETIPVKLAVAPGSYVVKADPTRLQQVLMNLAVNSRDAMPQGGELKILLDRLKLEPGEKPPQRDLQPGEWVTITVEDSGIGIAQDVLPHIFEPFFTTKPVGQGTGLGLAQVYGIIQQHNGQIQVESRLSQGTRFTIYLPASLEERAPTAVRREGVALNGKGLTVLVAEDDPVTLSAIRDVLETMNFKVLTAVDGIEALQLFEQHKGQIPLLVSDVVMPRLGGVELYQLLQHRWPEVKVLFVTGHPLDTLSQELLERGRVHWLQKPFSLDDFSAAIQALIG